MRYFILLAAVVLAGCSHSGSGLVKQSWPDVPEDLVQTCPDLAQVDSSTHKLSDLLQTVTDNYSSYYDCKSKVDDWIVWYNGQKKIYEGK